MYEIVCVLTLNYAAIIFFLVYIDHHCMLLKRCTRGPFSLLYDLINSKLIMTIEI